MKRRFLFVALFVLATCSMSAQNRQVEKSQKKLFSQMKILIKKNGVKSPIGKKVFYLCNEMNTMVRLSKKTIVIFTPDIEILFKKGQPMAYLDGDPGADFIFNVRDNLCIGDHEEAVEIMRQVITALKKASKDRDKVTI